MKALLDRNSLQVHHNLPPASAAGQRLAHFEKALRDNGLELEVSKGTDTQFSQLVEDEVGLVCVLTRLWAPNKPFSGAELDDLDTFVDNGGALLLMSNHPPYCKLDSSLSKRFDVGLVGCFGNRRRGSGEYVHVRPRWFGDHEIMAGLRGDIVFNNCTRVHPFSKTPDVLASLPDGSSDAFAVAGNHGDGRYVICGDSGFVGTHSTKSPGPGLLNEGNNLEFLMCVVRWLTCQPIEKVSA